MYRIFNSIEWVLHHVLPPSGMSWIDSPATGYGSLRRMVAEWAKDRGHDLHADPLDCDLELHVGDPGVKPDCHIHPSIILTMFEVNVFPPNWSQNLINWDYIVLPSQ